METSRPPSASHRLEGDLAVEVAQLRRMVAGLIDEVDALRAEARLAPHPVPSTVSAATAAADDADRPSHVSRRGLLMGAAGVAGTAAALAAGVATAPPAAAANGSDLVLGSLSNSASVPTGLGVSGSGELYGFGVFDGSATTGAPGNPGIYAEAAGNSLGVAIIGTYTGSQNGPGRAIGVMGSTSGGYLSSGVYGLASGNSFSPGVYGESLTCGVRGEGLDTGLGVQAISATGLAMEVTGVTGGVSVDASAGPGITVSSSVCQLQLTVDGQRNAPMGDTLFHQLGEMVRDSNGDLWQCVVAGTPGTWRKMAGPAAAGVLHVLPVPVRIYDSRPGTQPSAGTKSPLVANTARTLGVTVNSSGVPVGATAVLVNVLLVDATSGSGNFTIWSGSVSKPASNTLVWGSGTTRVSTLAVSALDPRAQVQVEANLATDLVLDVVGYFR